MKGNLTVNFIVELSVCDNLMVGISTLPVPQMPAKPTCVTLELIKNIQGEFKINNVKGLTR
jgi:hypothetical protein